MQFFSRLRPNDPSSGLTNDARGAPLQERVRQLQRKIPQKDFDVMLPLRPFAPTKTCFAPVQTQVEPMQKVLRSLGPKDLSHPLLAGVSYFRPLPQAVCFAMYTSPRGSQLHRSFLGGAKTWDRMSSNLGELSSELQRHPSLLSPISAAQYDTDETHRKLHPHTWGRTNHTGTNKSKFVTFHKG